MQAEVALHFAESMAEQGVSEYGDTHPAPLLTDGTIVRSQC